MIKGVMLMKESPKAVLRGLLASSISPGAEKKILQRYPCGFRTACPGACVKGASEAEIGSKKGHSCLRLWGFQMHVVSIKAVPAEAFTLSDVHCTLSNLRARSSTI